MKRRVFIIWLFIGILNISTLSSTTNDIPSAWFLEKIGVLQQEGQLDSHLFTNYKEAISRKDFAYLGVRLYELYTGLTTTIGSETFTDTSDPWVLKAKHIGIVSGFPDGTFRPSQPIRRDELAHLFVNVLKTAKTIYKNPGDKLFSDDQHIQSWAKFSVYTAYQNGLINGVGNNQYNPSGNATKEEALIIFYRGLNEPSIIPVKAVQFTDKKITESFLALKKFWPHIIDLYQRGYLAEVITQPEKGTVLLRFVNAPVSPNGHIEKTLYFAWNMKGATSYVPLTSSYYLVQSVIIKEFFQSFVTQLQKQSSVLCDEKGILIQEGPKQSPVFSDVSLIGDAKNKPWITENTHGDLWFSTWSDDGSLYTSWGDGVGFIDKNKSATDIGIAQLTGLPTAFTGKNIYKDDVPLDKIAAYAVDDKPSSLIYLNGQLIGQFHRPLEDPLSGYLAYSNDGGLFWTRDFNTPWTKAVESPFRCMFFINQGQNYSLNQDGYVYALGIGKEWGWNGDVYLARVKADKILTYSAYEYWSGLDEKNQLPQWTSTQKQSQPLDDLIAFQQFSAIYHPGTKRYIAMTNEWVYDAPTPWGPWTISGQWLQPGWLGYQPGIISKDTGEFTFWFTESGQPNYGDELPYQLCTGQIRLIPR